MTQKRPQQPQEEIRFTQNFLHSPALVRSIVELAGIQQGETVLEIGPGKGIITRELAEAVTAAGRVIAVELDQGLMEKLNALFSHTPQVNVINTDILNFRLDQLAPGYRVFSNIPFSITSTLLEMLFHPGSGVAQAHLIMQIDAIIGTNERSIATETFKSLLIKPFYSAFDVYRFSRSDFAPQPSVDAALFAFSKLSAPLIASTQHEMYVNFLAAAAKDRVGEGIWRRMFTNAEIERLADHSGLVIGRGLKSQTLEAIVGAFLKFAQAGRSKQELVKGAMATLREEQQRREEVNRIGGYRRPTK